MAEKLTLLFSESRNRHHNFFVKIQPVCKDCDRLIVIDCEDSQSATKIKMLSARGIPNRSPM